MHASSNISSRRSILSLCIHSQVSRPRIPKRSFPFSYFFASFKLFHSFSLVSSFFLFNSPCRFLFGVEDNFPEAFNKLRTKGSNCKPLTCLPCVTPERRIVVVQKTTTLLWTQLQVDNEYWSYKHQSTGRLTCH